MLAETKSVGLSSCIYSIHAFLLPKSKELAFPDSTTSGGNCMTAWDLTNSLLRDPHG